MHCARDSDLRVGGYAHVIGTPAAAFGYIARTRAAHNGRSCDIGTVAGSGSRARPTPRVRRLFFSARQSADQPQSADKPISGTPRLCGRVIETIAAGAVALFASEDVIIGEMMTPHARSEHRSFARMRGRCCEHPRTQAVRAGNTAIDRSAAGCLNSLQPLRERPVEILERHDIVAVLEARPAHDKSGLLFVSATAANGFGSRLLFELVGFVHTFVSIERLVMSTSHRSAAPRRSRQGSRQSARSRGQAPADAG